MPIDDDDAESQEGSSAEESGDFNLYDNYEYEDLQRARRQDLKHSWNLWICQEYRRVSRRIFLASHRSVLVKSTEWGISQVFMSQNIDIIEGVLKSGIQCWDEGDANLVGSCFHEMLWTNPANSLVMSVRYWPEIMICVSRTNSNCCSWWWHST